MFVAAVYEKQWYVGKVLDTDITDDEVKEVSWFRPRNHSDGLPKMTLSGLLPLTYFVR